MDEVVEGDALPRTEEECPCLGCLSRLQHDRLTQGVMAVHQPVVPPVQLLDQCRHWNGVELPAFASIAALAGQHKVPHASASGMAPRSFRIHGKKWSTSAAAS